MRKILVFVITLCLALNCALPVFAADKRVIDGAELLTQSEIASLEEQAEELYGYGFEAVILTMEGGYGGKSVSQYADDYYEDNGYGVGSKKSGLLMLINMTERAVYISTAGDGIYAFTDYSITVMLDEVADRLGAEEYGEACEFFLTYAKKCAVAFNDGSPIDAPKGEYDGSVITPGTTEYYGESSVWDALPVCLVIGFVIALIILLSMRAGMNTVRLSKDAKHSVDKDSFDLYKHSDVFLYSRTRRIPRNDDSSGGSRGGSTVHRSSGGVSHGGGGRKF